MSHEGVTLIYGAAGSGKTHLILGIMGEYSRLGATLSLDVTGDIARGLKARYPTHHVAVFKSTQQYEQYLIDRVNAGYPDWLPFEHVVCTTARGAKTDDAVELFKRLAWSSEGHVFTGVFCDEAEVIFRNHTHSSVLDDMCRRARNEGIGVVLATKWPKGVTTAVRSSLLRVCIFKLVSDEAVRASESVAPAHLFKKSQSLKRGQFIFFEDNVSSLRTNDKPPWKICEEY